MQKKCFSTWCNWYLSFNEQHALEVKDLFKDLADGSKTEKRKNVSRWYISHRTVKNIIEGFLETVGILF